MTSTLTWHERLAQASWGDSAAAVNQLGYRDKMSYVSTDGGALLGYMEGKVLPGVAALEN